MDASAADAVLHLAAASADVGGASAAASVAAHRVRNFVERGDGGGARGCGRGHGPDEARSNVRVAGMVCGWRIRRRAGMAGRNGGGSLSARAAVAARAAAAVGVGPLGCSFGGQGAAMRRQQRRWRRGDVDRGVVGSGGVTVQH
eukprot:365984-Chlamydomonas_euryale.AAC.5